MMTEIVASIDLYKRKGARTVPIQTGYRPHFLFEGGMMTSGHITLMSMVELAPGDSAKVEIVFLDRELLGPDFREGSHFTFNEGPHVMGEGVVLQIR